MGWYITRLQDPGQYREPLNTIVSDVFGQPLPPEIRGFLYVLILDDEPIAMAAISGSYIWGVCVAEYYRGIGYGSELLNEICTDFGHLDLWLGVIFDGEEERRLRFYRRFGFEIARIVLGDFNIVSVDVSRDRDN